MAVWAAIRRQYLCPFTTNHSRDDEKQKGELEPYDSRHICSYTDLQNIITLAYTLTIYKFISYIVCFNYYKEHKGLKCHCLSSVLCFPRHCKGKIVNSTEKKRTSLTAQFWKGRSMWFPAGITCYHQSEMGFMLHEAGVPLRIAQMHGYKEKADLSEHLANAFLIKWMYLLCNNPCMSKITLE